MARDRAVAAAAEVGLSAGQIFPSTPGGPALARSESSTSLSGSVRYTPYTRAGPSGKHRSSESVSSLNAFSPVSTMDGIDVDWHAATATLCLGRWNGEPAIRSRRAAPTAAVPSSARSRGVLPARLPETSRQFFATRTDWIWQLRLQQRCFDVAASVTEPSVPRRRRRRRRTDDSTRDRPR
jgi:hypothetical protein